MLCVNPRIAFESDSDFNGLMLQSSPKQPKSVSFADNDSSAEPASTTSQPAMTTDEKVTEEKVNEVTDMFKGLAKKKKSKKTEKKVTKTSEATDFDAKLAEAGADKTGAEKVEEEEIVEGDLEKGTGIWHHDATQDLKYPQLLERFFQILNDNHPDLMSNGAKSYKIPPPQCLREGNKKTIFANIAEICKRMKRSDEHVTSYLFAELGTSGSVDGSRRLVIKGRFQQKVHHHLTGYFLHADSFL